MSKSSTNLLANRQMNKEKSLAAKIAVWILVGVIPLLIISSVIAFAFNFQPLYEYGFHRYNVSQTTGLSDTELSKAARGLIDYFNSGDEFISITVQKDGQPFQLFNDREIIHLRDVKGLIKLDYGFFIGSLLYTAAVTWISYHRRRIGSLARPIFWGGAATLAVLTGVTTLAVSNFDTFFTRFHQLSFANDFWLLDLSKDYLIMLFPGGFWQDASIFIAALIGLMAVAVTLVGWRNLKREE
jgi:integral membrane protein (TIGR01906 family)